MNTLDDIETQKVAAALSDATTVYDMICAFASQEKGVRSKIAKMILDNSNSIAKKPAMVRRKPTLVLPPMALIKKRAKQLCPGCPGPDTDCTPNNCNAMAQAVQELSQAKSERTP